MSKFKIGDEIVAVRNHTDGLFKSGDEFIVDGFTCCSRCGSPCIYLGGINNIGNSICFKICNHTELNVRWSFYEFMFEKKISISECIEYRTTVSLPELTRIKEYQNQ